MTGRIEAHDILGRCYCDEDCYVGEFSRCEDEREELDNSTRVCTPFTRSKRSLETRHLQLLMLDVRRQPGYENPRSKHIVLLGLVGKLVS